MSVDQFEGPHYKLVPALASSRLLVFFAGTNKTDGKFDFWKVGNSQADHKLFLNNGENEWYQNGIPGFAEDIVGIGQKIERIATSLGATDIVLHGVSMGGYAAALFAKLIGCRAMAFGFDSRLRLPHTRSMQIAKAVPLFFPDISKVKGGNPGSILHIAGEVDAMDLVSASHLLNTSGFTTLTLRGVGHGGAPFIEQKYGLSSFISMFAKNEVLPEIFEKGRAAKDSTLVDRLVELHVCTKAKDWQKSEKAANIVLDVDPSNETANYWLGTILLANKQVKEATRYLAVSVGSAPHFTNAQYRLARAFMVLKDYERAKFHMQEHINLSPESVLAKVFLSDITRAEGRSIEADAMLREAYLLSPENQSVLGRMAKHAVLV